MVCTQTPIPSVHGNNHITLSFTSINDVYSLSNRHRKPFATGKKSLWAVSTLIEVTLFENSLFNLYTNQNNDLAWDFFSECIGTDENKSEVKLARFDRRNQKNLEWHGYPIDYSKDPSNKPDSNVLRKWHDQDRINKSELMRILKGKKGVSKLL